MTVEIVRIGIVNDMAMAVEALKRALRAGGLHQVIWVARDGAEAILKCSEDRPELVLMDLMMPGMNGVEATRRIMAKSPCPILVVTASVEEHLALVFEALGAGALDAVSTPAMDPEGKGMGAAGLLTKVSLIGKLVKDSAPFSSGAVVGAAMEPTSRSNGLLAIGSSAGGPVALAALLSTLPANFPHPIIIVQHLDLEFANGLASWLGDQSTFPVRLAREGDAPIAGTVLLAGTSDHLVFVRPGILGYTKEPKDYPYRPSVDVFFNSALRFRVPHMVGVLLTGMGRDGAQGPKAWRDAGCHTIAQDRATSVVYGMPRAAAAIGAAVEIVPLNKISEAVVRHLRLCVPACVR